MSNPFNPVLVDSGIRKKVIINEENFYLYVSDKAVDCTVPRENDPIMSDTRKIVETLCREITEARGGEYAGIIE